jgi:hypothetical protein
MVDADHNTSLSVVTRRTLLTGAATTPLLSAKASAFRLPPETPDPMMPLWQEWQRRHARATALCHRWQDIEGHLMRKVGFPQVRIKSPDSPDGIRALSHAEIDRALAALPCSAETGVALHADFANRQARWNAEAEKLGFDEIKLQEDAARDQEIEASDAILEARVTNLMGIEIKIALIVELGSTGPDDSEFPWPQLRSTLADVKRLRRTSSAVRC